MPVGSKKVVTFTYTLKDPEGAVLDTTDGREPMTYLHGVKAIVPGLEKALEGKGPGDTVEVTLPPEEAYGQRDEKMIRNVPSRKVPVEGGRHEAGRRYRVQTDEGPRLVLVQAVHGDYVTVDANHPLAGITLSFKVAIVDVRDATAEELEHGHVHGPGGHG